MSESSADTTKTPITFPGLAWAFLKIGSIGFGGGMAIIALMEHELVRKRRALESEEFLHGVGLGQLLGPFAVNTALFVGYRLYGPLGGLVSATAFMAPSLVLVLFLSWLYFSYHAIPALHNAVSGLAPVVIALILSTAWSLGKKAIRGLIPVMLCTAAAVAGLYRINPAYVLVGAGILGLAVGSRLGVSLPSVPAESKERGRRKYLSVVPLFWPFSLSVSAAGVSFAQLAVRFFSLGLVFFGGGFALIPLLHQTLVEKLGWLSAQEFVDGVAISNLTPGPVSVLATFAGFRIRGVAGALLATAALYLPAVVVMLVLCHEYHRLKDRKWAQIFLSAVVPTVVGLVLSTAMLLALEALHSWRDYALAGLALALLIRWKLPPALTLALGAAAGAAGILS